MPDGTDDVNGPYSVLSTEALEMIVKFGMGRALISNSAPFTSADLALVMKALPGE